jgi:hypothetical protein
MCPCRMPGRADQTDIGMVFRLLFRTRSPRRAEVELHRSKPTAEAEWIVRPILCRWRSWCNPQASPSLMTARLAAVYALEGEWRRPIPRRTGRHKLRCDADPRLSQARNFRIAADFRGVLGSFAVVKYSMVASHCRNLRLA